MPRWLNASARRRSDWDNERHVDGARRSNEVELRREVRGKVQFMARFRKNLLFLNSSESAIIVINMDGKVEERISGLLALNRQFCPVTSTILSPRNRKFVEPSPKEFRIVSRNLFLFLFFSFFS